MGDFVEIEGFQVSENDSVLARPLNSVSDSYIGESDWVGRLKKREPLGIEEASWKERDINPCQGLELVKERKEAREKEYLRLQREAAPSIVSDNKAEPWFAEDHHHPHFLISRDKPGYDRYFELSETRK